MKKNLLMIGLALGITAGSLNAQDCSGDRYYLPIFDNVEEVLDVQYGSALKQDGATPIDLFLDVYMPEGDTDTDRPLILLAHGGSFVVGDKTDLAAQCEALAKLGYVAATMQYRLLEVSGSVLMDLEGSFKKEVVRAVHDMRAAVRYFRKSVDEGNPYGINPDLIVVGGYSAGAILANHATYLDTDAKVPADLVDYFESQGGMAGESGNPGYDHTPQAVLSWCGAILDTNLMEPGMQPYFGMHNLGDQVVPNLEGTPNIGLNVPVTLQGDSLMYTRALNIDLPAFYKSYPGDEHCDFPAESSVHAIDFLHEQICVQNLSVEKNDKTVLFSVYPNPAYNEFYLDIPSNDWDWTVSVTNTLGQTVHTDVINSHENRITIDASAFDSGVYVVNIISKDGKRATKRLVVN